MNHIQQQDDSTCGVACAAMVAGVPFEVAHSKARQFVHKNGIGSREMGTVLRRLRVRFTRKLFPELCRTVPHIVVVPSLNVTGGLHYVVVDLTRGYMEVYDPQRGRPGKRYYRAPHDLSDDEGFPLSSYTEVIRIDGYRRNSNALLSEM